MVATDYRIFEIGSDDSLGECFGGTNDLGQAVALAGSVYTAAIGYGNTKTALGVVDVRDDAMTVLAWVGREPQEV
jgi:hypothetical protein